VSSFGRKKYRNTQLLKLKEICPQNTFLDFPTALEEPVKRRAQETSFLGFIVILFLVQTITLER
jgi:hypothetical protein